jgi:putative transposase
MNPPRASAEDYIQFLIATPKVASAAEAARAQPDRPDAPAHDAFTRLLHRLEPDPTDLWNEAQPSVRPGGALVLDDSVLDKPFARHMGLVRRCWSGRHRRVVAGIGLVTLLWTDGAALVPCDYRLADPVGNETKNDHFRSMLAVAKGRGLSPRVVLFDTWYSGKDNLKAVRAHGWHFLTRVRCNRRVNPDRTGNRAIGGCDIAATGTVVHLEGFGLVKAFRIAAGDGGTEHWITDDLTMGTSDREVLAGQAWGIEEYHRGLKQHCNVDRCQVRMGRVQAVHIGLAIRAFLRLEWHRLKSGVSWFAAKTAIVRDAVRSYLAAPRYCLPEKATA